MNKNVDPDGSLGSYLTSIVYCFLTKAEEWQYESETWIRVRLQSRFFMLGLETCRLELDDFRIGEFELETSGLGPATMRLEYNSG